MTFCLATLAHSWKVLSCSLSAGILALVWIKGNSNVYNGLRCIAMKSKNFHKGSLSDPWPIKPVWEWLAPVELIWFPISRIVLATRYHSVFKWLSKQTIRIFNPEIGQYVKWSKIINWFIQIFINRRNIKTYIVDNERQNKGYVYFLIAIKVVKHV